ncbi:MAG: TatD family hydrolase [Candidatus Thorarchaeota archaeon]|nr:TatD family hydrolase [Candidatus Thorarchaeota archaeon]
MKSRLIDTHCHMGDDGFDEDRESIIEEARSREIAIISSGVTPNTWRKNLDICRRYDNLYASIGLSPAEHQHLEELLEVLREHRNELIAIGECGLDYYIERDHEIRERQSEVFIELIQLANDFNLPIQIHSRSAGKYALDILKKQDAKMVHMHAFDGKSNLARIASNEWGYYFSIPTSVVRSPQKQKLVKAINIERLLIETDSPVLSPERGTRNTPSNLPVALQEVSRILRRGEDEMREIILENSCRLYKKLR